MQFLEAVHAQGANLRSSRLVVLDAMAKLDLRPWRNGAMALVGMGASHNALLGAVHWFRANNIKACPYSSSEYCDAAGERLVDSVIGVSQSGRSVETLAALQRSNSLPRLVLTENLSLPICHYADCAVALGAMEDSPVYTLGFTATLQALGLIADSLREDSSQAGWEALPGHLETVIEESQPVVSQVVCALERAIAIDVIASASNLAAAAEGALIIREAARLPAAMYETREYLHGPMEAMDHNLALIAVGDRREVQVAQEVARRGGTAVLITTVAVTSEPGLWVIRLPPLTGIQLATLTIVPIQLLTSALALSRNLTISGFRYEQKDTKFAEVRPGSQSKELRDTYK